MTSSIPIVRDGPVIEEGRGACLDDAANCVLFGAELSGKTHQDIPVKKGLCDMIGCAGQMDVREGTSIRERRTG